MKKIWIIITVIAILGIAGFIMVSKSGDQVAYVSEKQDTAKVETDLKMENMANQEQKADESKPAENPTASNKTAQSQPTHYSGEADIEGNDVQVQQVVYDGKSYTPSSLQLKAGDIVVFKNQSSGTFWPASSPHPQHSDYPEFDAKKAIPAGQSFQFKFTKVGNWKYHDHLNPKAFGSVAVTQ